MIYYSLSKSAVRSYRRALGINNRVSRVDPAVMERLDAFWDRMAGPNALTDDEKALMRACRRRFGWYEPTDHAQLPFIMAFRRRRLAQRRAA
jgi:hypothetical protein